MKIIALCCYRGEASNDFYDHLRPYVDGFVVLRDREPYYPVDVGDPNMVWISRSSANKEPFAFETRNRNILIQEAQAEGADFVLCLDADERPEKDFLRDLLAICEGATCDAYSLSVRDLWNSEAAYRVDGVWATKRKPVLFDVRQGVVTPRPGLHSPWIFANVVGELDYNIYHLGSMTPELRAERVRRHNAADPNRKYQADYDYLANEDGLVLESIPEGKGWK